MQTFMPYGNYEKVAQTLDYRRLGKQRVEGMQTHNQLTKGKGGYPHHPINTMWVGYESSLAEYTNAMIKEWIDRGYNNTMEYIKCCDDPSHKQITCYCPYHANHEMPFWADHSNLNKSHQANLLRKDFEYYSNHFDNTIDVNMSYLWWSKEEMDLEELYKTLTLDDLRYQYIDVYPKGFDVQQVNDKLNVCNECGIIVISETELYWQDDFGGGYWHEGMYQKEATALCDSCHDRFCTPVKYKKTRQEIENGLLLCNEDN